ncbi:hypothetical protein GMA3_41 [Gordonia phage GMA3]|uniref:Uncharacterized protein n=1 Tax=Gordonia phage GMA3 TaxID=1647284 RepID=A0A0K0NKW7_9CAUD|nr:hypothetical protein AU105_gp041 [Gordonia phage GMA3]AKL88218.1 hypothetical protein GMA3_41 [Gordonia phage GMA3]
MTFSIIKAFSETLKLSEEKGMDACEFDDPDVSHEHLVDMYYEMTDSCMHELEREKACRWLGYAQGVIVANGYATVEDMKRINNAAQ